MHITRILAVLILASTATASPLDKRAFETQRDILKRVTPAGVTCGSKSPNKT